LIYDKSKWLKISWFKGVIDTAFEEGKLIGILEGKKEGILEGEIKWNLEIAKALKSNGILIEIISQTTGLTKEQVENLN